MSDVYEKGERAENADAEGMASGEDARLPYEPPRLTKKRAVAKATLLTAVGSTMTGLTMMG